MQGAFQIYISVPLMPQVNLTIYLTQNNLETPQVLQISG